MASLTEALQVSIVKEIGVAIDKLKLSVMKKLSRQKAHLKSFPEASINEICEELKRRILSNFRVNMVLYAKFIERNYLLQSSSQRQISRSTQITNRNEENSLQDSKIESLRERALNGLKKLETLLLQLRAFDALLSQMNQLLYSIRHGAQSFEENNVYPLQNNLIEFTQKKKDLSALVARAKDVVRYVKDSKEREGMDGGTVEKAANGEEGKEAPSESSLGSEIEVDEDVALTRQINSSMKR